MAKSTFLLQLRQSSFRPLLPVPRNCVFGENIAHSTFIVTSVVRGAVIVAVVTRRRVAISVIVAGRPITIAIAIAIAIVTVSVAGVVGRIGSVWVAPVPAPPRTQPPWKAVVADKDDFLESVEATKPIISIKVAVIETVKASKAQG